MMLGAASAMIWYETFLFYWSYFVQSIQYQRYGIQCLLFFLTNKFQMQASAGSAENIRDDLNGLDKAVSAVLGLRTIERNQLLVSIAKSKLTKHRDEKNERITKPEELVRLYDLLIQVCSLSIMPIFDALTFFTGLVCFCWWETAFCRIQWT